MEDGGDTKPLVVTSSISFKVTTPSFYNQPKKFSSVAPPRPKSQSQPPSFSSSVGNTGVIGRVGEIPPPPSSGDDFPPPPPPMDAELPDPPPECQLAPPTPEAPPPEYPAPPPVVDDLPLPAPPEDLIFAPSDPCPAPPPPPPPPPAPPLPMSTSSPGPNSQRLFEKQTSFDRQLDSLTDMLSEMETRRPFVPKVPAQLSSVPAPKPSAAPPTAPKPSLSFLPPPELQDRPPPAPWAQELRARTTLGHGGSNPAASSPAPAAAPAKGPATAPKASFTPAQPASNFSPAGARGPPKPSSNTSFPPPPAAPPAPPPATLPAPAVSNFRAQSPVSVPALSSAVKVNNFRAQSPANAPAPAVSNFRASSPASGPTQVVSNFRAQSPASGPAPAVSNFRASSPASGPAPAVSNFRALSPASGPTQVVSNFRAPSPASGPAPAVSNFRASPPASQERSAAPPQAAPQSKPAPSAPPPSSLPPERPMANPTPPRAACPSTSPGAAAPPGGVPLSMREVEELEKMTQDFIKNMDNHPPVITSAPTEVCGNCGEALSRSQPAVRAMDKLFHSHCFCCVTCHRPLQGMQFYDCDCTPQCEECYVNSLAVCARCGERITDRVLKAVGQCFHAHCFLCTVCSCTLEGAPFITDDDNKPYCVPDYHRRFSPLCVSCNEPIIPDPGSGETVRVVALEKNFHLKCYRCEDCSRPLSIEADADGCYPLDGRILCMKCHTSRAKQAMK